MQQMVTPKSNGLHIKMAIFEVSPWQILDNNINNINNNSNNNI